MAEQKQAATKGAEKTTAKKTATPVVDTATGVLPAGERTPAPERTNPTATVHPGDDGTAKEAEDGREAAVEAAKASPTGVPEDQASTSGEPPVKDPERAPYGTTASLGYRPRTDARMAKDPNEALPENDRKWATATRARWGETTPAELIAEQREIDANQRKADEKAGR